MKNRINEKIEEITVNTLIVGVDMHFQRQGIATNHGDPNNWFPKHGKSMDTFRAYVKKLLSANKPSKPAEPAPSPTAPKTLYRIQVGAYSIKANADAMLAKIKAAGFTDAFIKTD